MTCFENMWFFFYVLYFTNVVIESRKPISGRQQAVWRLECELGVVTDPECPVDGGWSPWSAWTSCHGPCDDVGRRRRARECINPIPSHDGLPCMGPEYQIEPCDIKNCTIHDFINITAEDPVRTEALRQLSTVPSIMESCLQRDCSFEAIESALSEENTWQIVPEAWWNALWCVKRNLGCPVPGEWGPWGPWSACGARCGYGLTWRLRRCDTPPPSNAQLICPGTPLQANECLGDQCAVKKRDSAGQWGEWGRWTSCSESCGAGVRRRKRNCLEMTTLQLYGSWGTHCRGQHDQMEVCQNKQCLLNGGWSTWSSWGPCSQTCGSGKRLRFRSCTRPVPSGNGTHCVGNKVETNFCNLIPCDAYVHKVAIFNGESFLHYNFPNKRSTLFHFYIRFLPLAPHGILVRRGRLNDPLVRLSMQKWHICLDASGTDGSCNIPRICSQENLEPAVWHSALITITSEAITMRIDDAIATTKSTFICDPDLPDAKLDIFIGERFHGEIQELILNFIPLSIVYEQHSKDKENKSTSGPTKGINVFYEKGNVEEAYLNLQYGYYLRLPCFAHQPDWQVSLNLKSIKDSGTIIFFHDKLSPQTWLLLTLENMRLKMKLSVQGVKSQSMSTSQMPLDQWFNVTMVKQQDKRIIDCILNGGEHLHVTYLDNPKSSTLDLCEDEFFIGGVPLEMSNRVTEDVEPFSGILASVSVNNVLLNFHEFGVERQQDTLVQMSSRTASVSGYYHEVTWGWSNHLNLTCLHARSAKAPNNTAYWLYLDLTITSPLMNPINEMINTVVVKEQKLHYIDDGRVLRLVANANNNLRGFYTCRAHTNRRTRNIVTYGVVGKMRNTFINPDITTAIAVITTCTLVILTLSWLFIEGIHDIRKGYGFFRESHMNPEDKAEAICKFIDQNLDLIGSQSKADIAKAKARRIGKYMSSHVSTRPSGGCCIISSNDNNESSGEENTGPETSKHEDSKINTFLACAPSFVSSPRHGSLTSQRTKLSSSTYTESPRAICPRFLRSTRGMSPRAISSKINKSRIMQKGNNLMVIKSSRFVSNSPALKILEKFQQLKKSDDT